MIESKIVIYQNKKDSYLSKPPYMKQVSISMQLVDIVCSSWILYAARTQNNMKIVYFKKEM